ncbi:MAG: threonine--tRNA ligase [Patescibacteria group bacterium]|jgi:threonyl-tRNA synthetase
MKNLEEIRHSLSHIMAMAVLKKFPDAKLGIGPTIDNGFYYDFLLSEKLSDTDLPEIEKTMQELIKQNIEFKKTIVTREEALQKVKTLKQNFKEELINDLPKEEDIIFYQSGNFEDLCAGPHIKNSKEIPLDGFKLTHLAGAYWRGDEKNPMMTRIYGLAFTNRKDLAVHLNMLEQAKLRDHRKLGKELDLFVFSEIVGRGLPLFTPKGTAIWQEMERLVIEEENKRGYSRTHTPDLAKVDLYKLSGHWDHYQDSMYPAIDVDGEEYVLRPMTCPHQFMIYKAKPRSYRELPLRYAEIAKLYRKEQSGELAGLMRVMSFSLADAHIICRPDQLEIEFEAVVELVQSIMKTLGINNYSYRFSKWDPQNKEKYIDNPTAWHDSQSSMKKILDKMKLKYTEGDGEAAFYGPKLDVQMRNVNGKEDTAFTVQIDFALPEKFDMTYIDVDGQEKRPMVIHRSSIGCMERTMAFLIEQYAGNFPVWLSPVQIKILTVASTHTDFAKKLQTEFLAEGIRVELDDLDETVGNKIRKASHEKVPYTLVIGDKEMGSDNLAVRVRGQKDLLNIDKQKFIDKIKTQIKNRDLSL